MNRLKILLCVFILSGILIWSNPGVTRASSYIQLPTAIVLVQDSNQQLLVGHNFKYDNGLLVPAGDPDTDTGFYVEVE